MMKVNHGCERGHSCAYCLLPILQYCHIAAYQQLEFKKIRYKTFVKIDPSLEDFKTVSFNKILS